MGGEKNHKPTFTGVLRLTCRAIVLLAVSGCSNAEKAEKAEKAETLTFEVSGRLEDRTIREASGLARSQRATTGLLWIINDNGARELVHAIDHSGTRLGEFRLKKSKNRDWEDLASFSLDDSHWLMIADIGDNNARRAHRTLYFVEEPRAKKNSEKAVSWRVDFSYPDGPRDAESAAVDTDNRRALILSKRTLPPVLYAVDLQPDSDGAVVATRIGPVHSLPKPSRREIEFAPVLKDWHWQPVGMDISTDNLAAVILTYRGVYYYERQSNQDWYDALNGRPLAISLGNFRNAEAIAFGDDKRTVFVTGENKHSLVLRVDLSGTAKK